MIRKLEDNNWLTYRQLGKNLLTMKMMTYILSKEIKDNFEELEGKEVAVAGRLMFKCVMGKASFCNIQDLQGDIQVYVARDAIGEESYADFKKSDIGDIFGLEGFAFRTRTGENLYPC